MKKKVLSLLMVVVMLFSYFVPITDVFAAAYDDITFNVTFNDTFGEVSINNGTGRTVEGASYNGTLTSVGYTDSSQTNEITISTSFGFHTAESITINGIPYDVSGSDINTYNVPGASSYTIVVDGNLSSTLKKTIIWANTDDIDGDDQYTEDMILSHGSAKIIAVYDTNGNKIASDNYVNDQSNQYGLKDGLGWATVEPGNTVVFEFTPEYGYQLTSVLANGVPLEAQDTMNQYAFEMPDANIHFAATFTKTEDVVKANSDSVSSGSIEITDNEFTGGSVQLTVNDVVLSSDKISSFENAAGNYTISNYLDIDLYNVFYKGSTDDSDVWSTQIHNLTNKALITLKLEDGVDINDVVIVHNINDGDEFEIIEIESYDPETNTITFYTDSFSSYAIATTSNPKTGDNITLYISMLGFSVIGLIGTGIYLNKKKFN